CATGAAPRPAAPHAGSPGPGPPPSRHRLPPTAGAASARCSGSSASRVQFLLLQGSTGAASSVCSLPQLGLLPPPLWGRGGEGGGAGDAPALPHTSTPTPNPSPQGGGEHTECLGSGAHRACGRIVHQTQTNMLSYLLWFSPWGERRECRLCLFNWGRLV